MFCPLGLIEQRRPLQKEKEIWITETQGEKVTRSTISLEAKIYLQNGKLQISQQIYILESIFSQGCYIHQQNIIFYFFSEPMFENKFMSHLLVWYGNVIRSASSGGGLDTNLRIMTFAFC